MSMSLTKRNENSEYASSEWASSEFASGYSLSPQHSVLSTIFVGEPAWHRRKYAF